MDETSLQTMFANSSLAPRVRDLSESQDRGSTPWLVCNALYAVARDGLWCGTAAALLIRLQKKVPKRLRHLREWPTGSADLTRQTQRSVEHLHKLGVDVTFLDEKNTGEPLIQVARLDPPPAASAPAGADEQRSLFVAEDLVECARAAGGKRLR
jgi:hypothetical protein